MKVAIIYGFAEGPWHSRAFRKQLVRQGFELTTDASRADIVFAHSAGSFYIPNLRANQTLLLINPPYWPGRGRAERAKDKIRQDRQMIVKGPQRLYHICKDVMNLYYMAKQYRKTKHIAATARHFNLEEEIRHQRVILIRNQGDPWLTADLDRLLTLNPQLQTVQLTGEHDDCWLHPEPYVNLLQSLV